MKKRAKKVEVSGKSKRLKSKGDDYLTVLAQSLEVRLLDADRYYIRLDYTILHNILIIRLD